MTIIKVLGTGCSKCKMMYQTVLEALNQGQLKAEVIKVENMLEIMQYNVMSTPVLVIDEQIVISGRVPSQQECLSLIIEWTKKNSDDKKCCSQKKVQVLEPFFMKTTESKCCS